MIQNYLLPNIKNLEVLNHVRDGPMNIYLFKMTLKDNNVFYQGIVFFQNKEGGFEMESMMVDK